MMRLTHLHVHHVRNLEPLKLRCHPDWNLLIGPNGAGKTSILEAIHLLAVGRSFRSRHIKSVIAHPAVYLCRVMAKLEAQMGQRSRWALKGIAMAIGTVKVHAEVCERLSDFAAILPLQLITPETFKITHGGALRTPSFSRLGSVPRGTFNWG